MLQKAQLFHANLNETHADKKDQKKEHDGSHCTSQMSLTTSE